MTLLFAVVHLLIHARPVLEVESADWWTAMIAKAARG